MALNHANFSLHTFDISNIRGKCQASCNKEIKNQMQYWNTITYTKKCKTEDIKNGAEILMSSYKLWLSYREGATIKNDTLDESEEFEDVVSVQPEIKKADPKNLF